MHILLDSQRTRNGTSYETPSNETIPVRLAITSQGLSHRIFLSNSRLKNYKIFAKKITWWKKLFSKFLIFRIFSTDGEWPLLSFFDQWNSFLDLVGRSVMWSDPDLHFTCNKKDQMAKRWLVLWLEILRKWFLNMNNDSVSMTQDPSSYKMENWENRT